MTSVPRSAFVTGGSGFIGSALIRRLVAEGCRVRALARSETSAAAVAALGAEAVPGDLSDRAAMQSGAEGCEAAFHLAAHLGMWGDWQDFIAGNVDGTRNALEGCRAAGVKRFVHCGTEAALMSGEPLIGVDETAPLQPDSPAPYPSTKAKAEQLVRTGSEGEFEAVVVRPRFVWGAGDTTLLPGMAEMVEKGRFAWIGGGKQKTSVAHVDNVVEGLLLGAELGRPGAAYFITDGEDVVFREFVSEMLATRGIEAPTRSIPLPIARALRVTGEVLWGTLPLKGEPPLPRFGLWVSSQECTIDISKARAELGYVPIKSRADGLAEMKAAAA
ncbi:NAD-dependent epimerase/dehydratase family protein [soil metagenome]